MSSYGWVFGPGNGRCLDSIIPIYRGGLEAVYWLLDRESIG